jgi:hypothetical protein
VVQFARRNMVSTLKDGIRFKKANDDPQHLRRATSACHDLRVWRDDGYTGLLNAQQQKELDHRRTEHSNRPDLNETVCDAWFGFLWSRR